MNSDPSYAQVARDIWRAQREGPAGIARRQDRRLATLVAHARTHSAFYREAPHPSMRAVADVVIGQCPPGAAARMATDREAPAPGARSRA
jgi:hypothetical protein